MNKTGGPAFPNIKEVESTDCPYMVKVPVYGMTLLDYFAGQALTGLCEFILSEENIAEMSYDIAAAMIAERERRLTS